jgi:5-methylcytosine-specific restriction protein A
MWRCKPPATPKPVRTRPAWDSWYSLACWKNLRLWFLSQGENSICAVPGCNQPATDVDHKIPHKGNWALFMDRNNLSGLCKKHHSEKTSKEDGGFGHGQSR